MSEQPEKILVVDDDPALCLLVSQSLKTSGYTVMEAPDGQAALDLVHRNRQAPIDLLITDVEMPRIGGIELAEKAKSILPEVKILFMSGSWLPVQSEFIAKPFTAHALVSKVRSVLEATPEPTA